ncbi:5-oxoprolinase subunit PxpB [Thalassotalea sp. PS06]|uniref:5-oxoprolinase subunit PxpB n=1 Tax=Thalassotalea sp. PS06 TaxID=2594005 RepID=UPI0011627919|nr:5-oxoprolinase subunit PxpB [Thalassotalea sp. PS06]QDP01763.1 5-oxoprolinase subunit PxpB [Thalassotalea sp. PS06]
MSVKPESDVQIKSDEPGVPFYLEVASENSLIVYFGKTCPQQAVTVTPALCMAINQAQAKLKSALQSIILDMVPSYASLLITYDSWQTDHFHIKSQVEKILIDLNLEDTQSTRTITLPVYYDTSVGPDLERIASHAGITTDEVIQLHLQQDYYVYTIGFAPGFAYLGEVNDTIAMPRLATPRKAVAKGSVAIADKQTAIYPQTSPGGWNIIGRCPTEMFSPDNDPAIPVAVGDKVRFKAISKKQFLALGGQL